MWEYLRQSLSRVWVGVRNPKQRNEVLRALSGIPVEKIVERIREVPVEKIVEVERIVEVPVDRIVERVQKQVVIGIHGRT